MTNSQLCTFYIVRHGETIWNTQQILQGHADSPLTEKGLKEAAELAQDFKSITFDAAFSSDVLRAQRTAEIIALEHNIAVATNKLLRERYFGKYEGQKVTVYAEELKTMLAKMSELNDEEKFRFKLNDDIESDDEIVARFITFLRETAVAYPGKTVLVVTHGGMMRALLVHLGFGTLAELKPGTVKNLAHIQLDTDGVEFFIRDTHNIKKAI